MMVQGLMDIIYWCVKVKKVTGNNQCGFTKEKLSLTIAFCNSMGWLCGHGRRDGCHFIYSKALKTVLVNSSCSQIEEIR